VKAVHVYACRELIADSTYEPESCPVCTAWFGGVRSGLHTAVDVVMEANLGRPGTLGVTRLRKIVKSQLHFLITQAQRSGKP
jgi:hypothetical protein